MVKLTDRDKWLCTALPAILTLVIYGWVFTRPVQRETAAMRAELQAQDSTELRAQRLATAREESVRLSEEAAGARQDMAGLEIPAAAQPILAAQNRAGTLHRLSEMCASAGLTLGSARKQEGGPTAGSATGELLKNLHWEAAEPWRLELSGSFRDMSRWLDGLSAAGIQALPAGLDMEPGTEPSQPVVWTLDLWL